MSGDFSILRAWVELQSSPPFPIGVYAKKGKVTEGKISLLFDGTNAAEFDAIAGGIGFKIVRDYRVLDMLEGVVKADSTGRLISSGGQVGFKVDEAIATDKDAIAYFFVNDSHKEAKQVSIDAKVECAGSIQINPDATFGTSEDLIGKRIYVANCPILFPEVCAMDTSSKLPPITAHLIVRYSDRTLSYLKYPNCEVDPQAFNPATSDRPVRLIFGSVEEKIIQEYSHESGIFDP